MALVFVGTIFQLPRSLPRTNCTYDGGSGDSGTRAKQGELTEVDRSWDGDPGGVWTWTWTCTEVCVYSAYVCCREVVRLRHPSDAERGK